MTFGARIARIRRIYTDASPPRQNAAYGRRSVVTLFAALLIASASIAWAGKATPTPTPTPTPKPSPPATPPPPAPSPTGGSGKKGPTPTPTPKPVIDPDYIPTTGTTSWGTGGNWVPAGVPSGIDVPVFFFTPTGTQIVNLDGARTIGSLGLTNNGTFTFTLANGAGGSLVMDVSAGNASITVGGTGTAGNTISATVTLNDTTNFAINNTSSTSANGALAMTGTIGGTGGVIKSGAGAMTLSGTNSYSGTTTVRNGTLIVGAAAPNGANGALGNSTSAVQLGDASSATTDNISLLVSNSGAAGTVGRAITVNNNNSSGTTTIGTTNTTGIAAFGGTLTLNKDVTLVAATGGTSQFNGLITGSGVTNINIGTSGNTGTVELKGSSSNTYTGTMFVNFGTLKLNKTAGNMVTGDLSIASGATAQLSGSTNQIADTANVTVAGTFDLSSNSDTINGLTINGGVVKTGNATLTTGANGVSFTGGTLTLGTAGSTGKLNLGANVTVNSSSTQAVINTLGNATANVDLNGATRTFSIASGSGAAAGSELAISSLIQGNAGNGITKTGTGTLILSGANTYTGVTSIQNGTLSINTIKNLSTASAIGAPTTALNGTIAMGSTTTGGTLKYTGTGDTTNRTIDLAGTTGGATLDQSGAGLLKFSSAFTASGAGSKTLTLQGSTTGTGEVSGAIINNSGTNLTTVTKTGTGMWTLSGTNTYTGGTNINGGTLALGSAGALGTAGTISFGGGTLQYSASNTTDYSSRFSTAAGQQYKIDTNGQSVTFASNLTSSGGLLNKLGAGTLTLTGNNTYADTVLNAGQININSATAVGTGIFEIGDTGTTIDNTSAGAITLTNNNGFLLDGGDLTFVGTRNLNLGTGNFVLDGDNRVVTVVNSNATLTIGGVISDDAPRNLTKDGNGALTVSGSNTYRGKTILKQGTLVVSNLQDGGINSSIGKSSSVAGNLVIGGGGSLSSATLLYVGSGSSTDRFFTLDSGTNIFDSSGTGALNFTNGGPIAFAGSGNRSLTLTGSNTGENTIHPDFSDPSGGVFALVKTGGGTWSLTGNSSYTGTTFIGDGTLGFNNGSLGTGLINFTNPNPGPGGAVLRWNTGNTQDVSSRIKINDGVTATMNTNGNDVTFGSAIQTQSVNGSGALTKTGTGSLTLNAANTYSGGTKVNGGTLLVNGGVAGTSSGTGSGQVTVNSGGTLGGTGAISGPVVVNGGGTLAPGTSPGILHTGALTLNASSVFNVDLNGGSGPSGTGAGTLYDQVVVTGAFNLSGNLGISLGNTPLNVGDKFFIALNDGVDPVNGTFANATGPGGTIFTSGSDVFLINYFDNGDGGLNDISLTVTAVPEPGTWVGASLALGALLVTQRRRFTRSRAKV